MNPHRRILAVLLLFSLVTALFPVSLAAEAGSGQIIHLTGAGGIDNLRLAVAQAQPGDTIVLDVHGHVNVTSVGQSTYDDPWVIDKDITIEGGNLTLWACGIVLGGNVTFRNVNLSFVANVRNVIVANGYTLTMENVTVDDRAAQPVNLVCGAPTGLTPRVATVPQPGPKGEIILRGRSNISNIYAGNLSCDGADSPCTIPAAITLGTAKNSHVGTVYACGALQIPAEENWFDQVLAPIKIQPPIPSSTRFPSTGGVTVNLQENSTRVVEGATGSGENAQVVFTGGEYLIDQISLRDIAALTVASGKLRPTQLTGDGLTLTLQEGGTLHLSKLTDAAPQIAALHGEGGRLVLGVTQGIAIDGAVTGTTPVYISDDWNGYSSVVCHGCTYITAPRSTQDAFVLQPTSESALETFVFDSATGAWTAYREGADDTPLVIQLNPPAAVVVRERTQIEVDFNEGLTLSGETTTDEFDLCGVPLTIAVNGETLEMTDAGDYYTYHSTAQNLDLDFSLNYLNILASEGDFLAIPAGNYEINLTVPAEHSASGEEFTASFTLCILPKTEGDAIPVNQALGGLTVQDSLGQPAEDIPEGEFQAALWAVSLENVDAAQVIVGAYAADERLVEARMLPPAALTAGGCTPLTAGFTAGAEVAELRAFLLSGDGSLVPLCRQAALTAGAAQAPTGR